MSETKPCPMCKGLGGDEAGKFGWITCGTCDGAGSVPAQPSAGEPLDSQILHFKAKVLGHDGACEKWMSASGGAVPCTCTAEADQAWFDQLMEAHAHRYAAEVLEGLYVGTKSGDPIANVDRLLSNLGEAIARETKLSGDQVNE